MGLYSKDEKTDVPEIYKLSETHGMNWYDTYLLAKKTAVNHQIIVKRMQVQLEQAQAQTLGGDSALTETEEKFLKRLDRKAYRLLTRCQRSKRDLLLILKADSHGFGTKRLYG